MSLMNSDWPHRERGVEQSPLLYPTREPIMLYPSEWEYFEKRGVDMRPFQKITKLGGDPL